MSKLDAQRAMREANYAKRQASAAPPRKRSAAVPVAPTPAAPSVSATSADPSTCGHKSMNGRACTRPAGHSEKSHRYS